MGHWLASGPPLSPNSLAGDVDTLTAARRKLATLEVSTALSNLEGRPVARTEFR